MPQTQEEFYFALPHDRMDLLLYAFANDVPPEQAGAALGLTAQQVQRVFRDIVAKRRVAQCLGQAALLVADGPGPAAPLEQPLAQGEP
jgi:NAD+ synthase